MEQYHGTTILSVRRGNTVAMGGDGQVTLGNIVVKASARKVRRLYNGNILAGFAGGTADAFTLFERFEARQRQIAAVLGEEFPNVDRNEIRLCAALRQRFSVILVHTAMFEPALDRDSVVLDHFDSLSRANLKALGARAKPNRNVRAS